MPQRPRIIRRAVRWLRNRHLSRQEREAQRLPEEESQRPSEDNENSLPEEEEEEEEEETQRAPEDDRQHLVRREVDPRLATLGVIFCNRWIQSQRRHSENQRLPTSNEYDPSRRNGPIVQTFSLLEVPQPVQNISRSLTLVIVENGRRFRVEIIEVNSQFIIWTVTGYYPGWD